MMRTSPKTRTRQAASLVALIGLFCFALNVPDLSAAHGDYKKNGSYYVKVIEKTDTVAFTCDKYTQKTTDLRNNSEIELQVAHPIVAAVAFCANPEVKHHSVSKITSQTSDEWFYDPLPIKWQAEVYCEDEFGVIEKATKVLLYCWEEEMPSGFPVQ